MAKKTVLITSITGFLGAQILDDLVKAGSYKIKATVRNLDKGRAAIQQYSSTGSGSEIELVECKDLIHGDLAQALKGVDAILHVASPYTFKITDPEKDLLKPAIEGTMNVLQQAQKAGVTRVIVTSSFAAIVNAQKGGARRNYTYSEDDWNPATYEAAAKPDALPAFAYAASKKLAEKAAWDFAKQHPEMRITTMCPPMIYGPSLQSIESEDNINTSSAAIWAIVSGKTEQVPDNRLPLFCDSRDVSKAHLLALEREESVGHRVPLYGGAFTWEEAIEYLNKTKPEVSDRLPKVANPNAQPFTELATMSTKVAREVLGMDSFIDWKTTLTDTVDDLLQQEKNGWRKV